MHKYGVVTDNDDLRVKVGESITLCPKCKVPLVLEGQTFWCQSCGTASLVKTKNDHQE